MTFCLIFAATVVYTYAILQYLHMQNDMDLLFEISDLNEMYIEGAGGVMSCKTVIQKWLKAILNF